MVASDCWFLENNKTKEIKFLNVGEFKIGRKRERSNNDLDIPDGIGASSCSKVQCIISLNDDRVRLFNKSTFGTFVNDIRVEEIELLDGDVIRFINLSKLNIEQWSPAEIANLKDRISYTVRYTRLENTDNGSEWDDEVNMNEVLVSTYTVSATTTETPKEPPKSESFAKVLASIDLTGSDDEGDDGNDDVVQAENSGRDVVDAGQHNKTDNNYSTFIDDFEVGEPSSKGMSDSQDNDRPKTPVRNDPVSKAVALSNERSARNSLQMAKKWEKMEIEKENFCLKSPYSAPPKRIAHLPKLTMPPNKVNEMTPPVVPRSALKRNTDNPPDQTSTNPAKVVKFSADILLTPTEEAPIDDEPLDYVPKIRDAIINWEAIHLLKKDGNLRALNWPNTFESVAHYEGVQTQVMKHFMWYKLQMSLKPITEMVEIKIESIEQFTPTGHSKRMVYRCQAPAFGMRFKMHEVLIVRAFVHGSMEKTFSCIGVITDIKSPDLNGVNFDMEISLAHNNVFKKSTTLTLISHYNTDNILKLFATISSVGKSPLGAAIILPSKSRPISKDSLAAINPYVFGLNNEQKIICRKLLTSTNNALKDKKVFVAAVNGGPATGKTIILLQTLISFVRNANFKKKHLKILVTGPSDDIVDYIANRVVKIYKDRTSNDDIRASLKGFVRYGSVANTAVYKDVEAHSTTELIKKSKNSHGMISQTAQIMFSPMHWLTSLKKYSEKYDIILFDNASVVNEITSATTLIFNASALILFGDCYRDPKDDLNFDVVYEKTGHNLNRSMFKRMVGCERNTLNLTHTYRFAAPLLPFINHCFYGETLNLPLDYDPSADRFNFRNFALFHVEDQSRTPNVLKHMMTLIPPTTQRCGFISNVDRNFLNQQIFGDRQNYLFLSTNQNFTIEDKDIVIIWITRSMLMDPNDVRSPLLHHFRLPAIVSAITRAKKAVYFVGSTNMFTGNPMWRRIYNYAHRTGVAYDLNPMSSIGLGYIQSKLRL